MKTISELKRISKDLNIYHIEVGDVIEANSVKVGDILSSGTIKFSISSVNKGAEKTILTLCHLNNASGIDPATLPVGTEIIFTTTQ